MRAVASGYAVPLALLFAIALFSVLRPDTFFTADNFRTILVTQSVLIVLALGVTVALAAGEFDLSIAALLGFSASLVAFLTSTHGWSPALALLVSLGVALAVGVTNGVFVVVFGVNSFITTLGTGTFVTGLATAIVGATTIGGVPAAVTRPMREELLSLDLPVFYALALALVLWFLFEHTPTGRFLFFTGEGREAARLAGVRVDRMRFGALVTSAVFAWFAGLILVGQTGAANTTYGVPFLLPAFAAGFLGATTIRAGRYNVWGTVMAVLLLAVGTTGLQLLGAAGWVSDVFNGAALVLAVTLARIAAREE
ncbi:MAG: ABC transporter permease [Thermoleophilia bacterium]|nr:ABC transporter permease [Thermoleophilia bacterium]